jgi:hypothetical protein
LFPAASCNCTAGCAPNAAPLLAVDDGCVVRMTCAAAPGPSVIVPDTVPVKPAALNASV